MQLRARQVRTSGTPSRDTDADQPEVDAWRTLSPVGQERAQALYESCMALLAQIGGAQVAHVSRQRAEWLDRLTQYFLVKINTLASDSDIDTVAKELRDYSAGISTIVAKARANWARVDQSYRSEHDWLRRQNVDDATLAAKQLEDMYKSTTRWLDRGAIFYITDEDYIELEHTLQARAHLSTGILQGARLRAHDMHDLLDIVRELRVDEQDPDKYVPGWRKMVDDELDHLGDLAKRTPATPGAGYDSSAEFRRLRDELREQRDAMQKKRPLAERVAVAIVKVPIAGAEMTVGVAEAIVGPLAEIARELVDEAKIGLYYVTGGRYMPTLTSDLMKAFEHGATRIEVLKGMAEGLVGTPGRLLQAVEDGDWESVGKEAMNLYLLVELVKASPKYVGRVSAVLATTRRALRVLRARTLGLRLRAPRLIPEPPPLPRDPVYLGHDPAAQAVGPIPRFGPTTTPPRLPESPKFLADPPAHAPKPLDSPPAPPKLIPYPAIAELRDLFLEVLRTEERTPSITVARVGFGGVQAFMSADGVLTVYRDSIFNIDKTPGQGKLIQAAFEEAAKEAARAVGATRVRVAMGTVLNQDWAAYLMRRGYFPGAITTSPGVETNVLMRTWWKL